MGIVIPVALYLKMGTNMFHGAFSLNYLPDPICWVPQGGDLPELRLYQTPYDVRGVESIKPEHEFDDGFPEFHNRPESDIARRIMRGLMKYDIVGETKRRFGIDTDGGYTMYDFRLDKIDKIIAIGVEDDTSVEEELVK